MSHSEADSSGAKAAEERQAKLMKQTQQISLLEESNMYLKQTAVVSEQKAKELEEKVSGLEKKIKPIPRAKAQLHGIPQWTRRFRQNHSGQCSPHLCQARWVAVAGSGTQPSRFLRLTCYQEQQPKESRCLQNNNQVAVYRLVGS